MGYRDKADENLRAAEALFGNDFVDPSASRYYYAMFQGALHVFRSRNLLTAAEFADLRDAQRHFNHGKVATEARRIRLSYADSGLLRSIRILRNDADYEDFGVEVPKLRGRLAEIRSFLAETMR